MAKVTVLIGSGSIGVAIARRVSAGKHILLADLRQENADAAAAVLSNAGFEVSTAAIDVSSRKAVESLAEEGLQPWRCDRSYSRCRRFAFASSSSCDLKSGYLWYSPRT